MGKIDLDKLLADLDEGSESPEEHAPADADAPSSSGDEALEAVEQAESALTEIYSAETQESTDLGQWLLSAGAITGEQLNSAMNVLRQSPGQQLEQILLDMEVPEEPIRKGVAHISNLQYEAMDLSQIDTAIDVVMVEKLTPSFCKQHELVPLRRNSGRLVVGVTSPDNIFLLDEVKRRLGISSIKVVIVTRENIMRALETLQGPEVDEEIDLESILEDVDEEDVQQVRDQSLDSVDLEKEAGESPVIRYVNFILQSAVKEGASDIHIEPGEKGMKVRFRIDGVLFEMMQPPRSMSAAITSRLKIMANLDISERRLPQDGRIRCVIRGRKLDLRMSTLPNTYGEKTVMRILDTNSINVTLDQLGFDENTLTIWKNQVAEPHGIVLVTGPTGSGKTTTLYSSLRTLDKAKLNISTVEDPVEYHLDGITQTQIHDKIGMSFAAALRALLRQDPDVVLVGEIRDHETAHIAVQASLTGHLVLSTLHTNDAPSSITRLVNIGLEPFLVGAAVNAVLAQRLIRRICQNCKTEVTPSEDMQEFMELNGMPGGVVYKGEGCEKCRKTGYNGRCGIYELLVVNDEMRDIVARNPNVSEFRRMCIERGMTTLRQDGLAKASQGLSTIEEVLRVTESH
ncbi:MAG: GspE/PulE family protein [Phycisphaerales bacterium JB043]